MRRRSARSKARRWQCPRSLPERRRSCGVVAGDASAARAQHSEIVSRQSNGFDSGQSWISRSKCSSCRRSRPAPDQACAGGVAASSASPNFAANSAAPASSPALGASPDWARRLRRPQRLGQKAQSFRPNSKLTLEGRLGPGVTCSSQAQPGSLAGFGELLDAPIVRKAKGDFSTCSAKCS